LKFFPTFSFPRPWRKIGTKTVEPALEPVTALLPLLKNKSEVEKNRFERLERYWKHAKHIGKLSLGISDYNTKERDDARLIVRRYTTLSIAGGLIPIPYLDVIALTALQIRMLAKISEVYGVEFTNSLGKLAVTSLMLAVPQGLSTGFFSGLMAAMPATKFVPVAGTVIGEVAMASFGATITYALGEVFIEHFESGGTLLDFDAQAALAIFEREIGAANRRWNETKLSIKERFDRMRQFRSGNPNKFR